MKFIVFEGLDGSGKSSLMSALEKELQLQSHPVYRTREPGGTPLGDEIRELILRKKPGYAPSPRSELLLYQASRAQHVDEVILPKLKAGFWVLCDRFSASSVAFQAGGRALSVRDVEALNAFSTQNLPIDLTVLLDLSVEESKSRRSRRSESTGESEDRIESEKEEFHERVRQSFLTQAQAQKDSWLVLNAALTPQELLDLTLAELRKRKWI